MRSLLQYAHHAWNGSSIINLGHIYHPAQRISPFGVSSIHSTTIIARHVMASLLASQRCAGEHVGIGQRPFDDNPP